MPLANEARESYHQMIRGFDLLKARVEGLQFQLQQDVREALRGNNSPELLREIFKKSEKLRKFRPAISKIEKILITEGIKLKEISVQ